MIRDFSSPGSFLFAWFAANCCSKEKIVVTREHERGFLVGHAEQAAVISAQSGAWVFDTFPNLRHQPQL